MATPTNALLDGCEVPFDESVPQFLDDVDGFDTFDAAHEPAARAPVGGGNSLPYIPYAAPPLTNDNAVVPGNYKTLKEVLVGTGILGGAIFAIGVGKKVMYRSSNKGGREGGRAREMAGDVAVGVGMVVAIVSLALYQYLSMKARRKST
jgi:hypothetical protein